ncbi:hypothetical protein MTQ12_12200 [Brevibacterium sp. R8603A2]|uniref:hypothetical protein n=1 Tax=Brevibacterium sp. R8603A2 TaxID=2929779 RepID=UPI001FFB5AE9|nr:hypothetical protein [Brevibacterium sp. R8603A2]MCK1803800.1 hypothetical protein [Brevibacterium sp. R8603A2]
MFGLPAVTTAVLIGIPLFWVLYTIGFLVVSRNWAREDADTGAVPGDPAGPGTPAGPAGATGGDVR